METGAKLSDVSEACALGGLCLWQQATPTKHDS